MKQRIRIGRRAGKFNAVSAVLPLVALNVIIFIIQNSTGGVEGWFTQMFQLSTAEVLAKPWLILTSMFLHGGSMHLLFNMYALWIFGPLIEHRIGRRRFLFAYFASGILAGIFFTVFNPNSFAVGASGAIMGILGIVIVLLPNMRVLFFFVIPMSMRTAGILFALIDLIGFVSSANTGIAHIAHLGGLAFGVSYGIYLLKKRKTYAAKVRKRPSLDLTMSQEEIDEYFKNGRI